MATQKEKDMAKLRRRVLDICNGLLVEPYEIDDEYISMLYESFSRSFGQKIEQLETVDSLTARLWERGVRPNWTPET